MTDLPDEPPALAAARAARAAQAARVAAAELPQPLPPPPVADPVRFCVWTTVALLAWIFSPALVVAAFGIAGLYAYARAWRLGLRRSSCILGDVRIVMLYLAVVTVAGLWTAAWRLSPRLSYWLAR